jgi:hypothetical protein
MVIFSSSSSKKKFKLLSEEVKTSPKLTWSLLATSQNKCKPVQVYAVHKVLWQHAISCLGLSMFLYYLCVLLPLLLWLIRSTNRYHGCEALALIVWMGVSHLWIKLAQKTWFLSLSAGHHLLGVTFVTHIIELITPHKTRWHFSVFWTRIC